MTNTTDTQTTGTETTTTTDTQTTTTTTRRRFTRFAAIPLAGLAAVGIAFGAAGIASAGTMPSTGPTIAMTIHNTTGQDMILQGSDNPYGEWIHGPNAVLAPGASEIVTATNNDPRGIGVDVTYSLPGDAQAVFTANNYSNDANTSGTRMTGRDGHFYSVYSTVDTGFPTMNAGYSIVMN